LIYAGAIRHLKTVLPVRTTVPCGKGGLSQENRDRDARLAL